MRIGINKLSSKYKAKERKASDAASVLKLECTNPFYFEYCPPTPNIQSVLDDMKVLSPKKSLEDKYYIGFFEEKELIYRV